MAEHIVVMEKEQDGKTFIYDPQIDKRIEHAEFKSYGVGKTNFRTMDLTNVSLDETFCDKILKKRN